MDASVWIAAQDTTDTFCRPSRDFLARALTLKVTIHVPGLARVETGCALARKLRDAEQGRQLADQLLMAAGAANVGLDHALLDRAFMEGTNRFLRGADAIYAAAALRTLSTLISWDKEHLKRGGAETPSAWLKVNP